MGEVLSELALEVRGVWELEVWHVRWEVGERPQTGGQGVVGCAPLPTGDHLRLNSFICERSW